MIPNYICRYAKRAISDAKALIARCFIYTLPPDWELEESKSSLEFEILVEDFVPRQALLVKFGHKVVGIKLLDVPYARTLPFA